MPPKRGRTVKETNPKLKVAKLEDNFDEEEDIVEKKAVLKRGRKPPTKVLFNDKKLKKIVNDDVSTDDDDDDDDDDNNDDDDDDDDDEDDDEDEVENAELKQDKKIIKKPTRVVVKKKEITPVSEEDEPPKQEKRSGRKQRAPTKRKIVEDVDDTDKNGDDIDPVETTKAHETQTIVKKIDEKIPKNDAKAPEPSTKIKKNESKALNPTETDLESINYDCDKFNNRGEKYNLKISSWNVSGIRALTKKNGMEYFVRENADIVAVQETKCDIEKLPNEIKIPGYKDYFLDSDKSGYCGVGLYCKDSYEPIEVKYGLNNSELDKEGRLITAEFENFYLVNVYVPNAGNKLVTMPKRLKWNKVFKAYIKSLDAKKPVIICGDMNVAHEEIDLTNPKANMKNAGFTKEEREGMTDLLKQGFVDTFRQLYPDKTGAYTFWSYFANSRSKNIGWRLDYFIVSESIKDNICDNVIRSSVNGSDHCPIVLYANL